MCMSPDRMSNDRLREAVEFYRNAAREELAGDPADSLGDGKRWNAKADRFEALLRERLDALATDMEEIFAAVVVEEPAPELVTV